MSRHPPGGRSHTSLRHPIWCWHLEIDMLFFIMYNYRHSGEEL
jgi:hypothetical protein